MAIKTIDRDVVISARDLTKHYRTTVALESLDLAVRTGEVYGFLGPNGSGKTTAIRCVFSMVYRSISQRLAVGPRGVPAVC